MSEHESDRIRKLQWGRREAEKAAKAEEAAGDPDVTVGVSEEPIQTSDIGLSIDMLDADRLRHFAQNLLVYGPDITHWSSVPFVVSKLQTIATGIEKAVKDIGLLRLSSPEGTRPACRKHKTPKRAHFYCVECRESGDNIIVLSGSAEPAGDAVAIAGAESTAALASPSSAPAATSAREICTRCQGNGVLPIRNSLLERIGVETCPRCHGDCWEPPSVSSASRPAQRWQPIESAPKDGTKFLAWMHDVAPHRAWQGEDQCGCAVALWTDHNGGGWVSYRLGTPTHWMPLPGRPQSVMAPEKNK